MLKWEPLMGHGGLLHFLSLRSKFQMFLTWCTGLFEDEWSLRKQWLISDLIPLKIYWMVPSCLPSSLPRVIYQEKNMVTSSIGAIFVIILINSFWLTLLSRLVSWCSWLSRQSNTLKVSGSSPGDAILSFFSLFLTLAVICWSWFSICCELYALHRRMNCNSLIWTVCW